MAGDADDVERLEPAAAGSRRLQAQALHLPGDVFLGQPIAPARGPSTLEQVAGQEADVGADQLGADLPGGRLLGRGQEGRGGDGRRGVGNKCEDGDEGGGKEELHPPRIAEARISSGISKPSPATSATAAA